jgi:DnaK suppressor protein
VNDPQIDHFRRLLIAQRDALREAGAVKLDPLRDDAVGKVDDDLAPLSEMAQVIASNRNRDRAGSLQKIEAALARLEADPEAFGDCEECGDAIPPRRLELMPWTTLCVACQGARENPKGGARRHITDYK